MLSVWAIAGTKKPWQDWKARKALELAPGAIAPGFAAGPATVELLIVNFKLHLTGVVAFPRATSTDALFYTWRRSDSFIRINEI